MAISNKDLISTASDKMKQAFSGNLSYLRVDTIHEGAFITFYVRSGDKTFVIRTVKTKPGVFVGHEYLDIRTALAEFTKLDIHEMRAFGEAMQLTANVVADLMDFSGLEIK